MTEPTGSPEVEESVKKCYSTWSESYYADYYQSDSAYPPVHTELVRRRLAAEEISRLLDAGCGPASMLRDLGDLGIERYGFDLTPEMVEEARKILGEEGVPAERVWQGSVVDPSAFRGPEGESEFDAAICFGVLPHIPAESDAVVLKNLAGAVRPGGLVMVEARNQLFALFTLNRYSRDFFLNELIRLPELEARASEEEKASLTDALKVVEERFRLDLPPVRKGKEDEPGYDEVLSRTHNPFELRAAAAAAGLEDVEVLFYHYHALPPLAESELPGLFRRASLALEDPTDWRGHFMASAFVLAGRRPA